jgi:hypothetical protein
MPLGGVDMILRAPANECLGDVLLRACLRHWSGNQCYFQDAEDEEHVHSLAEPWVWQVGVVSKEFFVYQNKEAVAAWAEGPTRSNRNTMLHFIIGQPLADESSLAEVAVVCDRITPEIRRLVEDLKTSFASMLIESFVRKAA